MSERADELLDALASSSAPLGAGLAVARAMGPRFTGDLAARFGGRPSVRHVRTLIDLGRALGKDAATDETLGGGTPAGAWLRAGIRSGRNDHQGAAAAALDSIHDEPADVRAFRELFCARQLATSSAADDIRRAWEHLRRAAFDATDQPTLLAIDQLRQRLGPTGGVAGRTLRVAVLGSVSLDLLAPALRAACLGRGIAVELHVGRYGLHRQELIGPDPELDAFAPEVVVLVIDERSLGLAADSDDPDGVIATHVADLRRLWTAARDRWSSSVLQTNFVVPAVDPFGALSAILPGGRGRLVRRLDLALWEAAAAEPGVHIVDAEQIAGSVGRDGWDDPVAWLASKQVPGPAAVPAFARQIAACLQALSGLSAKCVVLDLDNTLWGGAVGDVGPDGIELGGTPAGEAYLEFQRFLRALPARGIALAVCSKNDEDTARAPFRDHPEMLLREGDLTQFVANWSPKAENLRAIASALNIGVEALAFVDDNPLERQIVRQALPTVHVVELPSDPAGFASAVAGSLVLEALTLTEEDHLRVASFKADAARIAELGDGLADIDAILDSLDMVAEFGPFSAADVPRLHQLTNKTNQFNFTTVRMTENEVRSLMTRADIYTQAVRLKDRYGEYGLVALLFGRWDHDGLHIDQWLMSCRVFGRKLEDAMIARAARTAMDRNIATLRGTYRPTAKNREVRDLYGRLGFALLTEEPDGARTYVANAAEVASRPLPRMRVVDRETQETAHAG